MQIERFRKNGKLFIRAKTKNGKAIFKHCAGEDIVPNRDYSRVVELLILHSVGCVVTDNHESV